jgi:sulfate adenylyltransferase
MLIAFQTRNPIHRSHFEMIKRIAEQYDVLIHPVIGPTKDDDIDAKTRVLTYEAMRSQLPPNVFMSYLPYNMQVGGPREALQHAIIRRNYGCDGMIVGRDHAGCKNIKTGIDIYGPYDAQTFVGAYADKLTVNNHPFMFLTFSTMIYSPSLSSYIPEDEYKHIGATDGTELSGTKFRQMITSGEDIPAWYSFDTTIAILRKKTAIL